MQQDAAPARVTVALAAGTVTLLPRRAPVGNSGPIRGETVTVLPLGATRTDWLLAQAERVAVRRLAHAPATLDIPEVGVQPGLAVLGLTEAEAVTVGSHLGLTQVFFWDGRRAALLACPPTVK
jgi:hypothetical protein